MVTFLVRRPDGESISFRTQDAFYSILFDLFLIVIFFRCFSSLRKRNKRERDREREREREREGGGALGNI